MLGDLAHHLPEIVPKGIKRVRSFGAKQLHRFLNDAFRTRRQASPTPSYERDFRLQWQLPNNIENSETFLGGDGAEGGLRLTERRAMLAEHGQMARGFADVRANTVASLALGDYEWILAFEADELHRIVDLMRHLRGSGARLHVREEIPFYTGRRRSVADLVADLP